MCGSPGRFSTFSLNMLNFRSCLLLGSKTNDLVHLGFLTLHVGKGKTEPVQEDVSQSDDVMLFAPSAAPWGNVVDFKYTCGMGEYTKYTTFIQGSALPAGPPQHGGGKKWMNWISNFQLITSCMIANSRVALHD